MNIVIIGCGKIGCTLVENLSGEGHDVTAVDVNDKVISEIGNTCDVITVAGSGTDCDVLSEANADKADLFIAATGSDELNMLSCFLAKRMGAKHTVARIRDPEYSEKSIGFMRQQLELSLAINPELQTAKELCDILKYPGAAKIETFSVRNFEMIELVLREGNPLIGLPLTDIRKKFPAKFLICAVQRDGQVTIPDGSFVLNSGDKIALTADTREFQKILKDIGVLTKQARNVMILGASKTAWYLAKMLLAAGNSVKIIEKDEQRCKEFSDSLPGAVMIYGDGASAELLREEGISSMDAFVALTGLDEQNILISVLAESSDVPKVVAKINRTELVYMAEKLGLESSISPKRIISNVVSRYARALENSEGSDVETLYKVMDGDAEVLEFKVQNGLPFLGRPFREMNIKKGMLIAGIVRGRQVIIPSGEDSLLNGDKVVVIAAGHCVKNLTDIVE